MDWMLPLEELIVLWEDMRVDVSLLFICIAGWLHLSMVMFQSSSAYWAAIASLMLYSVVGRILFGVMCKHGFMRIGCLGVDFFCNENPAFDTIRAYTRGALFWCGPLTWLIALRLTMLPKKYPTWTRNVNPPHNW